MSHIIITTFIHVWLTVNLSHALLWATIRVKSYFGNGTALLLENQYLAVDIISYLHKNSKICNGHMCTWTCCFTRLSLISSFHTGPHQPPYRSHAYIKTVLKVVEQVIFREVWSKSLTSLVLTKETCERLLWLPSYFTLDTLPSITGLY